jgi:hypothetical protein
VLLQFIVPLLLSLIVFNILSILFIYLNISILTIPLTIFKYLSSLGVFIFIFIRIIPHVYRISESVNLKQKNISESSKILSSESNESLLIPAGFSHGTISLLNGTTMLCVCSGKYMPEYEAGININSLNLNFIPKNCLKKLVISSKDRKLPSLSEHL